MKAIEDFPTPDTPKKIWEIVGLAIYFRLLLPDFSAHSTKLTDLFKKESPYKSGPLPEEALQVSRPFKLDWHPIHWWRTQEQTRISSSPPTR